MKPLAQRQNIPQTMVIVPHKLPYNHLTRQIKIKTTKKVFH